MARGPRCPLSPAQLSHRILLLPQLHARLQGHGGKRLRVGQALDSDMGLAGPTHPENSLPASQRAHLFPDISLRSPQTLGVLELPQIPKLASAEERTRRPLPRSHGHRARRSWATPTPPPARVGGEGPTGCPRPPTPEPEPQRAMLPSPGDLQPGCRASSGEEGSGAGRGAPGASPNFRLGVAAPRRQGREALLWVASEVPSLTPKASFRLGSSLQNKIFLTQDF